VDALGSGYDLRGATSAASAELRRALAILLRRARESGEVRSDASVEDVLALLAAAMSARSRKGASAARVFAIVCDGLRFSA